MIEKGSDLNQRIAAHVREFRAARGISLDGLAGRSGVSRSMISLVERGESSPTAVVLEKLAAGLGVPLASLFDESATDKPRKSPVARRDEPRIMHQHRERNRLFFRAENIICVPRKTIANPPQPPHQPSRPRRKPREMCVNMPHSQPTQLTPQPQRLKDPV